MVRGALQHISAIQMATIEYFLYRVKFVLPKQLRLIDEPFSRPQLFVQALEERPGLRKHRGGTWHIGNLEMYSDFEGYFAVGRTTHSTIEKFDVTTGNFIEEELETSPYTHAVFDARVGFVGIANKASLSPTTNGIARRLAELLAYSRPIAERSIQVEVPPIPDPESFLREIDRAHRVFRFAATFHRPNPFDADEYFQKPLSTYLAAADGEQGKAQISGEDLNREVLEAVTKSTAATGNEASARIQREPRSRSVRIRLSGNALGASYDEELHDPREVLQELKRLKAPV